MALSSSASRSWCYDVFPSFRGEDVRKSFLSYLLKELHRKSIHTFIDNGIERSRPITPELLLAIEESKIAIVVFSRNYASSTWCLNELVKIHHCSKESGQLVLPIFYDVDTSDVRKQTGDFGKAFKETCQGKTEDEKQGWNKALVAVADMAGYDLQKWDNEADMTEKIANDVSNKLNSITPSDDFRDFVGIEAHLQKLNSMLCLESGDVKMVGIVGTSGIGKSTIGRALYHELSSQFDLRSFQPYKRAIQNRKIADDAVKLSWVKQLLSNILDQNDIKIDSLSVMKQRLKNKKVLIVLDDVDERELLETLVGQTGWFGFGSRIIVVTQDRELLKSHKIDLIYDVKLPSEDLALQMLCRSAFRQNHPPEGFMELADEVVELSGKLPLGLTVLGSSLREKNKEEWIEMLPRLRDGLYNEIEKTLRVSYDGLGRREQDIFLFIACLYNGEKVDHIKNMLGKDALRILADRSLISIRTSTWSVTTEIVEMHGLLEKLGREIVRAETDNPGKRRILWDAEDISDVFTDHTGTEAVVGIHLDFVPIREQLSIAENSFEGMHNLQFLQILSGWGAAKIYLPQGHVGYLPRKLRLLNWDYYPAKSLPSSFSAEYLVELIMKHSKLEKLWEGTQPLRSLKKMNLRCSEYFKEIPDLSNATNLEELDFSHCTSLLELPSSIRNLNKLTDFNMDYCSNLEVLPTDVCFELLDCLNLLQSSKLTIFPRVSRNISELRLDGTAMEEEDCLWIGNYSKLSSLHWINCPLRWMPSNFNPEHLVHLYMEDSKLERLWEGVQSLRNLLRMVLSESKSLKAIPDLSKATNLTTLDLNGCSSLVTLPSSVQHLDKLEELNMERCTSLEVLPTNINLVSLTTLDLRRCSRLTNFPHISTSIKCLFLDDTAIEEVPSWIENMADLEELRMSRCTSMVTLPSSIQHLDKLKLLDMERCTSLEVFPTNINLASLTTLSLKRCSRLTRFPQISTSIKRLFLDDTAIEEVPSWIENMADLEELTMLGCEKLRKISATIKDLRNLSNVEIENPHVCGSHTSLAKTVAEIHAKTIDYYSTTICNCCSTSEFLLARGAQEFILQSDSHYEVLPGKQVPLYFTHRTSGASLSIPLPQSSLSKKKLEFEGCIILDPGTDYQCYHVTIIVHWKFRGITGIRKFKPVTYFSEIDRQVMFHFDIDNGDEIYDPPPSQLDCNSVEFEFEHHNYKNCHCYSVLNVNRSNLRTCPIFPQKIKGCGIRVMSVSPSLNADGTTSETEYNHQSREELDAEIESNKKRMKTTVVTSQEPSNTLCGQTAVNSESMAPNLELFLGICETSAHVSSRGKVPSPSIPLRNTYGDGPSLSRSLTPSDPVPGGEYLYIDPVITEQQDAETPLLDPLSSPQLINFFSQSLALNLDLSSGPAGASSNFHGDGPLLSLSITPSDSCLGGETLGSNPMVTEQLDRGGTHCDSVILSKASKRYETEDNQRDRETDAEPHEITERDDKYQSREENDVETEGSKKRMQVTFTTPGEPSVSLCGQTVADTVLPAPILEGSLDQEIAGSDFEASVKKRGLEGRALGPSSSTPFKKLRRTHSF